MRRYLASLLIVTLSVLGVVASYNALIDPLWFFSHENRWNGNQVGFDERQQKTNRALFGTFDYDAILLGSSRSTYINQRQFTGVRTFNFAVSGMRPVEYPAYLQFSQQLRGKPLAQAVIGLDFFASSRNYSSGAANPEQYFSTARRPFYRAEMLLSVDTLKKSKESVASRDKECDCYDRSNAKHLRRVSMEEHQELVQKDLAHFRKLYGDYVYDERLPSLWQQLKSENPGTQFVIFTTPVSAALFGELVKAGRLPELERWLRDAVNAFGELTDFMGVNSITIQDQRYQDASHFYPATGDLIARRLSGSTANVPKDFGIRVTAENLDMHIAQLRKQAAALLSSGSKSL